jgi:hypothetical protein
MVWQCLVVRRMLAPDMALIGTVCSKGSFWDHEKEGSV